MARSSEPPSAVFFPPTASQTWLRQRHPRPDPVDPLTVLRRIRRMHGQHADVVPAPPAAGSPLAADDAALNPYQLSHALALATGIALDHLEAFRALIQDAGRTQPWAPHTLLRAALENAATAVWLIGPDDAADRRYRRLKLQMHETFEGAEARRLHGQDPPSGRTHEQVREQIRSLAPDARSLEGRWSYRKVVRWAAEHIGHEGDAVELLWRLQSGLAHGRAWATIGMLEREEHPSPEQGVVNIRLTTSVDQVMPAAAVALQLLRAADKARAARGTAP